MAKFIIECPKCGTHQQASTGFFSKKILECKCGNVIDIKKERYSITDCPHCGNSVLYDQVKGRKETCPVCKEKLFTQNSMSAVAHIHCTSCSCEVTVDKNATSYTCPLCQTVIDVQKQIRIEEEKAKGLANIIKYEGENDVLVWKHPIEDFNAGSQLIVHESQQAIFFKDGQALDLFGPGRHTLTTQQLPMVSKLFKMPFNELNPFHSEVYFINMVTQTNIKWGTDSKVRMFDPMSGLYIELGACGEFTIQVDNARKLLIKLIGTTKEFKSTDNTNPFSTKTLTGKFKALIVSKVKTVLSKVIKDNNINILEVDAHTDEIGLSLKDEINKTLEEYGLLVPEFYVTNILTPDDDPNFRKMKEQYAEQYLLVRDEQIKKNVAEAQQARRIVEAQTGAQEEIIAAQAKAEAYRLKAQAEAQEMQMKGYTYQQETQRLVATSAVENGGTNVPGAGSGLVGDMVNLGVGLGVATQVVGTVKDAMNPMINQAVNAGNQVANMANENVWNCSCGQSNITSAFCPNCGAKKPEPQIGWTCPTCHKTNIISNFCPDCGCPKPVNQTWNCSCGQKDITSNFCPNCGAKKA